MRCGGGGAAPRQEPQRNIGYNNMRTFVQKDLKAPTKEINSTYTMKLLLYFTNSVVTVRTFRPFASLILNLIWEGDLLTKLCISSRERG